MKPKLNVACCCALQDVPERLRQLRDPGGKLLHGAGKHRSRDWWKVSLRDVDLPGHGVALPASHVPKWLQLHGTLADFRLLFD